MKSVDVAAVRAFRFLFILDRLLGGVSGIAGGRDIKHWFTCWYFAGDFFFRFLRFSAAFFPRFSFNLCTLCYTFGPQ